MIAIDTHIVVRFLTQDDVAQFQQVAELFRQAELFIPERVLLETEWVLRLAYGFSPGFYPRTAETIGLSERSRR